jgi:hypothetical protein
MAIIGKGMHETGKMSTRIHSKHYWHYIDVNACISLIQYSAIDDHYLRTYRIFGFMYKCHGTLYVRLEKSQEANLR